MTDDAMPDDGDAVVDEGHEQSDEGDGPARPAPRAALVLAITLAVIFAGVAIVLAFVAAGSVGGDGDAGEVRAAAGRFGEALVTYDYRHPDDHRDAVLAQATGSFRDEYRDAFDQGLRQFITEAKATSKGTVKDVYVAEVDDDQAQAIVVADIEHDGTGGKRTLYDVYFRVTFVRVDGEWKVDEVTDLNFDTGATTPTTAPGTPTTSGSTTTSVP